MRIEKIAVAIAVIWSAVSLPGALVVLTAGLFGVIWTEWRRQLTLLPATRRR
jgi:hypothetical protein